MKDIDGVFHTECGPFAQRSNIFIERKMSKSIEQNEKHKNKYLIKWIRKQIEY